MAERLIAREAISWVEKLRNSEWHGLTSRSLRTKVNEGLNSLKRRQDRRTQHLVTGVGVDGARAFHRFGQAAADRAEGEGRDIALWS